MTDTPINPEANNTSLQKLDAGVRLKTVKTSGDEALAWAKKNGVDLDQPGDRVAIINTARIARSLDPFWITTPATVPTTPATRDGHPSVAAVEIATVAKPGEVEMRVATDWAKAQGLVWGRVRPYIDEINDERRRLGLPRFRIKARGALPAPYTPEPVISALPDAGGDVKATWTTLPASRAELIDMAHSFNGLVSGIVTPELASWLLELNTGNRRLNTGEDGVKRFVAILKSNTWLLTGEPIIVSSDGIINDGQHRLHGIVESGIAAWLDVRFGIDRSAFVATGQGARRTVGQILSIAGRPNGPLQGAIARWMIHYDSGEMNRHSAKIEASTIEAFVDKEPSIGRVAKLIGSVTRFRPIRNSNFAFVLAVAARAVPMERVEEFARRVEDGQGSPDCGARRLHVRLADTAMARVRLPHLEFAVLTALAWNAWFKGEPAKLLRVGETHRQPGGFPKIVTE